jgi:hypothetical protein
MINRWRWLMHVVVSSQGRGSKRRGRPSFDAVAQINRQLGVHRACVEVLLEVTRDVRAKNSHRRILAEVIDWLDEETAIATIRLDRLAELTVSPSRPDGYAEWIVANTLRDLGEWGYLEIDWPTGRYTLAVDDHPKGCLQ